MVTVTKGRAPTTSWFPDANFFQPSMLPGISLLSFIPKFDVWLAAHDCSALVILYSTVASGQLLPAADHVVVMGGSAAVGPDHTVDDAPQFSVTRRTWVPALVQL